MAKLSTPKRSVSKPAASRPAASKPAASKPSASASPEAGLSAARKRASKAIANTAAAKVAAKRRKRDGLTPGEIEAIFFRFHAIDPEPKGELESVNAYTLLVAVALSAQATDIGVNKATRSLFQVADTPARMLALGEEKLISHIKTIGLYRNKAKNVIALSQRLIDEHDGEVPADRAALEALPGVGRKTANVVLNMAFGIPTIAVDTHLFRVANRTGLAPGKTPLAVELGLEKVVPDAYRLHAHHWLILHGRYVCKAAKPLCPACVIKDICRFEFKTAA